MVILKTVSLPASLNLVVQTGRQTPQHQQTGAGMLALTLVTSQYTGGLLLSLTF